MAVRYLERGRGGGTVAVLPAIADITATSLREELQQRRYLEREPDAHQKRRPKMPHINRAEHARRGR